MAKNPFADGLSRLGKKPAFAAGVSAALIGTPMLLKNKDRGYTDTAAVTTPLIVGGALGAQELFDAARANGGSVYSFIRNGRTIFGSSSVSPSSAVLENLATMPGATITATQRMAMNYFSRKMTKGNNPLRQFTAAANHYNRLASSPKNHGMLTSAIINARYQALTMSELSPGVDDKNIPMNLRKAYEQGIAPNLDQLFQGPQPENHFIYRPEFLKRLNMNLRKVRGTTDFGAQLTKPIIPVASKINRSSLDLGTEVWDWFESMRPDLAPVVRKAIRNKTKVYLTHSDSPLALTYTRSMKSGRTAKFTIPIADTTGAVHTGKNFSVRGAARHIFDEKATYHADVFLAEQLSRKTWTRGLLKDLKLDKQRAFIFNDHDPLDEFHNYGAMNGSQAGGLTEGQIRARVQQHVPTNRPVFHAGDETVVRIQDLNAEQRLKLLDTLEMNHGLKKYSSEGSFQRFVMDSPDTAGLNFGGLIDPSKQMTEFRALSKPITLVRDPSVPDNRLQFRKSPLRTTQVGEWFGAADHGAVGMRVGGVSPLAMTVFGDLPGSVEDLDRPEVGRNFRRHLIEVGGINERKAKKTWDTIRRMIQKDNNLLAVRDLGRLGEGGVLTRKRMGGLVAQRKSTYIVDRLHLSDDLISKFKTESFGSHVLLGTTADGRLLTAAGDKNYISNIRSLGEQSSQYAIDVTEHFRTNSGTKLDYGSIKGLNVEESARGDVDHIRQVLNKFSELTAKPGQIINRLGPDIDAISPINFTHDKANPFEAIMGAAVDTVNRIDQLDDRFAPWKLREASKGFKGNLAAFHTEFTDGGLIADSKKILALSDEAKRERIAGLVELSQNLMAEVGQHIRDVGGYNDPLFKGFRRGLIGLGAGRVLPKDAFLQYSVQNNLFANTYAWNTTKLNLPTETKLTFDMQGSLYDNGYHSILKDFQDRLRYPQGDPGQARAFMDYVARGDFSKPLGETISLADARTDSKSLSTAADRLGTVFDPENKIARNNYSIDLGDGRYLPVLGHDAFKGHVNPYGEGIRKFSVSSRESALRDVLTNSGSESSVGRYLETMKKELYGKKGLLRADAVLPDAASGFIQTAASELRHIDGSVNPFQVRIGTDMAERYGFEHGQYAMLTRHPVSATPFVQVHVDPSMRGTNLIGVDVGVHNMLHADDDQDIAELFPITRGGEAEAQAAAAVAAGSKQHEYLNISNALLGVGDDTRRLNNTGIESLSKRVSKFLDKTKDARQIMRARTTGASVGSFSNVMTKMALQLESNSALIGRDAEKTALGLIFWQATRQAAIAAQKGNTPFTIEDAEQYTTSLNSALARSDAKGADMLHRTLLDLTKKFEKPTKWIPEMESLGIQGKVGDEVTPMTTWLQNNREAINSFSSGLDPKINDISRLLTAGERALSNDPKLMKTFDAAFQNMGDAIPYIQGPLRSEGAMANEAASVAGKINDAISDSRSGFSAAREKIGSVYQELRGSLNLGRTAAWVGAGAGIAAVAGVLSARTFGSRPSSNSIRPEEAGVGQDMIPSEPAAGSRSPSGAPRNVFEPVLSQRTTYVSPIQSAVNVDVHMRGENQQDGVEKAKLISRMSPAGSSSNITVINRNATRLNSLRFRSQIREARGF